LAANPPFVKKIDRITLDVHVTQRLHRDQRNLRMRLLIDLPRHIGNLCFRVRIQHARKVVDISRGLQLRNSLRPRHCGQRNHAQQQRCNPYWVGPQNCSRFSCHSEPSHKTHSIQKLCHSTAIHRVHKHLSFRPQPERKRRQERNLLSLPLSMASSTMPTASPATHSPTSHTPAPSPAR